MNYITGPHFHDNGKSEPVSTGIKHDLIDQSNLPLFLDFAVLTSEKPYKEENSVGMQCVKGNITSLLHRLEICYQGIQAGQPKAQQQRR